MINVSELRARSYVESCKQLYAYRCPKICFDKKYYQTVIILHIYIKQYRSFEVSNIT